MQYAEKHHKTKYNNRNPTYERPALLGSMKRLGEE